MELRTETETRGKDGDVEDTQLGCQEIPSDPLLFTKSISMDTL